MLERRTAASWRSGIYVPEPGYLPPTVAPRGDERVLHVRLMTAFEQQPSLTRALQSLAREGEYAEIDWIEAEKHRDLEDQVIMAARRIRPTLVFIQTQRRTAITPQTIAMLHEVSDPSRCVVVNWDGDQHFEPRDKQRRWFVELGQACDASLVVNTQHPAEYAALGVRGAGYLQIGVDDVYRPRHPTVGTPEVVFLASAYDNEPAYARRRELVAVLSRELGGRFAVYGGGWRGPHARPMLRQAEEPVVYSSARFAVSMSIRNDLPRYTSDRLFRALASGACVLVERFPDMDGLGLRHGENCFAWDGGGQALGIIANPGPEGYTAEIRERARRLAEEYHTWGARMPELTAIVEAVRGSR